MWVSRIEWRGCAFGTLSLLLIATLAPPFVRGRSDGFTRAEQQALARGELVTRKSKRKARGLELIGGSSWQVIEAPPEVVWRALHDTRHYHRMLPQVREARVAARPAPGRRTVFFRQGAGPIDVSYYLKLEIDPEHRDIRFELDSERPRALRAAWGSYSVRAYPGGRTLLAYGIMADLGRGMLRVLVRETVHDWMLKVPWTIKRFVEGSGRWIYDYEAPSLGVSVRGDGPAVEPSADPSGWSASAR